MSAFSHIAVNVSDLGRSVAFYINALGPIGFAVADSEPGEYARLTNGMSMVIVLSPVEERFRHMSYHRRAVGLHHVAIAVGSREIVDRMADHLRSIGVELRGAGIESSGYRRGYYSLFFEDPDRMLIELVHHDPFYFSHDPPDD